MDYATDTICTYVLTPDSTLGDTMRVAVDYFFLTSVYVFNGTSIQTAESFGNPTKFRNEYFFDPQVNGQNNNVYLVMRPHDQTANTVQF